ncbi:MAG: ECF transporter S component [Clostridiales bacterium]|jgi:energy-coupling factor transport system substrate-specific component|nr:ECF transporter S component [Clostridiales bacterium]
MEEQEKSLSRRQKVKRVLTPVVFFVLIPLLLALGVWAFGDRSYNLIAAAVALLACVPFFVSFERRQKTSREIMVIAVMTGISVLGRFVFAPLPGFKPVTAVVIIAAISLGGEAGFIIGALSAIVSNIYFGQGPWTPFQMFSWGALGFLAGLAAKITVPDKEGGRISVMEKRWALIVAGIVGGALYSMLMDVWTVLAAEGTFGLPRYWAAVAAALPWVIVYAASNIVFLLLLTKPFVKKLERIKIKYEIFTIK